jgi:hypothetical protein
MKLAHEKCHEGELNFVGFSAFSGYLGFSRNAEDNHETDTSVNIIKRRFDVVCNQKLNRRMTHHWSRPTAFLCVLFVATGCLVSCDATPQTPDDQVQITSVTISKVQVGGGGLTATTTLPATPYEYQFYWDFAGSKHISDWTTIVSIPGHSFDAPVLDYLRFINPVLDPTTDTTIFFDTSIVFYGRWERSVMCGDMEKFRIATPSVSISYY